MGSPGSDSSCHLDWQERYRCLQGMAQRQMENRFLPLDQQLGNRFLPLDLQLGNRFLPLGLQQQGHHCRSYQLRESHCSSRR